MIMISKMRYMINPRKRRLNREEANVQEPRNRLDMILFLLWYKMNLLLIKKRKLPPGCKPVGYKWIFKKKMKADGTIDKYKARLDTNSRYVILCLYVDDMLIVGNNDKMIKSTKDMLKSKFDMKDMGLANVILRIKIIRTQNGLVLSQAHHVDKILNAHNAGDFGLARTPIDTNLHLSKNRGVGVAQLELSSDANWISYINDSRSTSGYVFTLGGAVISWKFSKQTVIANSTMESEFVALDKCGEEAEWLHQFVEDIPRWPKLVGYAPTPTCARGCRKGDFWAKMGSKLLNSCEPVGPEDTNAAPKARLCVYLFAADFISKVPD
ncbi:retrotransposon protein, putative, ty1-copia subclass [Tanacetum coccineum]